MATMRKLLTLSLYLFALPVLAARGDPLICDPPPSTSPVEPCAAGSSEMFYFSPAVFSATPRQVRFDLCVDGLAGQGSGVGGYSWIEICEANTEAPRAQMMCVESDDHTITCEASPRNPDAAYLWEADERVILTDKKTNSERPLTSFVCTEAATGTIMLTVVKGRGGTTTIASDVRCTGVHEIELDVGADVCPTCASGEQPIDPPGYPVEPSPADQ